MSWGGRQHVGRGELGRVLLCRAQGRSTRSRYRAQGMRADFLCWVACAERGLFPRDPALVWADPLYTDGLRSEVAVPKSSQCPRSHSLQPRSHSLTQPSGTQVLLCTRTGTKDCSLSWRSFQTKRGGSSRTLQGHPWAELEWWESWGWN